MIPASEDRTRAIAIHIGLNAVDPAGYAGWPGELTGAEADARAMAEIARARGITQQVILLRDAATIARVIGEIRQASAVLTTDDYLLITFAGHGASFPKVPVGGRPVHDPHEPDDRDEAWCLYDHFLLDDQIHACLTELAAGVRVCVVSDSCYSGSVLRDVELGERAPAALLPGERERRLDPRIAEAVHRRDLVAGLSAGALDLAPDRKLMANVVLLAACRENEVAIEGEGHGRFTEHLLAVWDDGKFRGSHGEFLAQIATRIGNRQHPQLYKLDPFLDQVPFTRQPATQSRSSRV